MRYFFDLLSCGLCLFPFSPQAVCSKKCAQFAVYERVNNFFAFGLPRLDAPRIVTSYDVGDPKFANRFIITIKASPSRSAGAIQVSSSTSGALPIPSSTQELNITTQTPVIVEVSGTPEVAEARFRKAEESTEAPVINREIKLRQLWTELWDVWVPKLEDDTYVFFDALLYKLRNMRNLGDALLTTWSVVCNIAEGFILPSACFIYSIIGALGHLIFLTSVGPFIDLTLFTGSLMIAAVYAVCQFVCHYKRIKDVERMRDMLRQKRASLDRIPSKEQLDGMILAAAKLATIPLQLKLWLRQLVLNKYMRENHRLRASNAHKAAVIVTRDADLATRDATIVALRVTDGEVEARRQALIARQTHNTLPAPRDPGSPPRSLLWLQNTLLRPLAGDSYEDRQALRDIVQGIKSFMKAAHANIGAADEILLLKGQMRADITNLRRVGEDELRETYIEYQRLIKKNDAQLLLARKACDDEISTAAHAHALEVARLTAKLDHLERKVGDEQVLRQRAQDEAARNKLAASMIQAPPPAATQSCGTQADLSQMEESEVESNSQARDEEGDESEAWETGGCGSDDKSDDHDSGSDDDSDDEDSNGNPSGPVLTFPGTRFPASLGRYTVTWPADQAEKIDAGESVAKKEGQQDEEGREDDEEAKEEQEETGKQEPEVRKKDNREDTDGQAEDGEDEEEHVNQMHALKGSNNEEDDKRQSGNQLQEDQTPNDAEHEQPPSATNLAGDRGSVGDSDSERVTKAIGELRSKAKALAVLNKTSNDEMAVLEAMAELHQFALTNIPSQHRMSALKVTGAGAFMQRLAKGVTRTQGQGQNMLVQSNAQSIIDLWRLLPPAIEQTTEAYAATIRTVDSVAKENPAPTSQASAPTSGPSDGTAEPKSSDNKPTSPKKASASNGFDAAKFAGSDFGFGPNASANASKTSAADGEDSDDGKLRKKRSAGPRLSGTAAGGSIVPLSSMTPSSFSTLPDVNFGGPTNASFPFSAPGSTNGAVAASNDSITAGSSSDIWGAYYTQHRFFRTAWVQLQGVWRQQRGAQPVCYSTDKFWSFFGHIYGLSSVYDQHYCCPAPRTAVSFNLNARVEDVPNPFAPAANLPTGPPTSSHTQTIANTVFTSTTAQPSMFNFNEMLNITSNPLATGTGSVTSTITGQPRPIARVRSRVPRADNSTESVSAPAQPSMFNFNELLNTPSDPSAALTGPVTSTITGQPRPIARVRSRVPRADDAGSPAVTNSGFRFNHGAFQDARSTPVPPSNISAASGPVNVDFSGGMSSTPVFSASSIAAVPASNVAAADISNPFSSGYTGSTPAAPLQFQRPTNIPPAASPLPITPAPLTTESAASASALRTCRYMPTIAEEPDFIE